MSLTYRLSRGFSSRNVICLLLGVFSFLFSCTEPESLNPGILPGQDLILINNAIVKEGIISVTSVTESALSDEMPENLLGSLHDPEIGKFSIGFLCQFLMEQNNPDFGVSPVCDSLILTIPFSGGAYGFDNRLQGLQKIKVYQLNRAIFKDSVYYSSLNPASFCDLQNPLSTVFSYREGFPQSAGNPLGDFKVSLPVSLGQSWLNSPTELATNQTFVNFFKGLLLRPDFPDQEIGVGSIWNLTPLRSEAPAKISLYYHQSSSPQLSQTFSFPVTPDCARINFFEAINSSAVSAQLADSTLGRTVVYGRPGSLAPVLYFPFIEQMRDTFNGGINRAELLVKIKPASANLFSNPASLVIQDRNSSGIWAPITEVTLGSSFFNGNFEVSGHQYRFNISVYLQEILRGKRPNTGLRIISANPGVSPEIYTLLGSDDITLKLTLTKEN
jgi:hypothetical protein